MKKQSITTVLLFLSILVFGQAKKPTIMVVPSDNWCISNNYTITYDEMGTTKVLPDYKKSHSNGDRSVDDNQ